MRKIFYIVLLMHASCLMVEGQVIDKYFLDYGYSSPFVNFQHEPATIERDTSYYSYSSFNYYNQGLVVAKNTGKWVGRLYGHYIDTLNNIGSGIIPDTLTSIAGDTIKVIPDKFIINNKQYFNSWNYISHNFYILPDKHDDTIYHLIFYIDSLTTRRYDKSYSYLFYRVDFSISKNGTKLLTPYPVYLGFIPDANRAQKYTNYEPKYNQILFLNSMDKFYFYTFVQDTECVYSCDLQNIKLEQMGYKRYYSNTFNFPYTTSSYPLFFYYNLREYFSNRPYFLIGDQNILDTINGLNYNTAVKIVKENPNSHFSNDGYFIDSLIHDYPKRDTVNIFYTDALADNGRYLYTLQINEIYSKKRMAMLIKKYDLYDTLNNTITPQILYSSFVNAPDTQFGNYDYGRYKLTKGPCGRIFVLHNYDFIFTINKPDEYFGHEKTYNNFPVISYPDSTAYNYVYLYFWSYNNLLHYNYKLNTTEEYHTNSVILHTDADTAYKTFIWYAWNKQTQQFDSSTGTSCYIPNIGSGIYYKLKGTTAYGYSAWFSDSLYARYTCPKAKFGIEQIKHCQYNTTYFYDSSTTTDYSPGIPHSWHWDFGDGTDTTIYSMAALDINGKGNITHIYTKSGLFKISLIYYNGVCSDTFTQFQPIYITPAPQPGFNVDPMKSCIPEVFHIIPSHQDTIVSEKYYIYKNSYSLQDSFVNIPISQKPRGFNLNQKDSGIYKIKQYLTGTTGCTTSDSITLQFDNRPILKLMNDTFICSDEVLQLSATSGNYRYQWNTGDTSQSIIINKARLYSVNVINGSCVVSDSTNITQDLDKRCKLNISVYPNPFGNEFKVAVYSRTTQNINIQLYEMSGKQIASYNNIPVNQFATFSVKTADLASAMYVLHIFTNEKKFVYKVVKLGD